MSTYVDSLIREAPLFSSEKLFLYTVSSHHDETMFATAKTAAWWMGISLRSFYKHRSGLIERGCLIATEQGNQATVYRIDTEALRALSL